ncbi:glycosyltransferase family 2 protein [Algoriphagus vanfongensis]|uniref:glycosyltransferase family 2 protein n=1 Tax=Algoriphagus vanfongensis TaxID=426371 RepID=UPI00041BDDA0|nr:glycosyltransferase [Algoriphagus vanfongensis]
MKVSVIIPVYNQSHYLFECIESVIRNCFSELEIIIVNDGSTDDTETISKELALKYGNIKIISQENRGLSEARNSGFKESVGDLIHFLDADDKVFSMAYSNIVDRFQESHDLDILVSGYSYFRGRKFIHTHQFSGYEIFLKNLVHSSIAPPASFFLTRRIVQRVGLFDGSLKSCEDWDYWIRASKIGAKIVTIPEVLVAYRYVPNSMSRNPKVMYKALTEVSRRAGKKDARLPKDAPFNQEYNLDYLEIQKKHLIRMLGVMLHQGNVLEAEKWYRLEQNKWNWKIIPEDWKGLSSYLSWAYFFEKKDIKDLQKETFLNVEDFFIQLGYSKKKSRHLSRMVFAPQLKKLNHIRYGKVFGAVINRLLRF